MQEEYSEINNQNLQQIPRDALIDQNHLEIYQQNQNDNISQDEDFFEVIGDLDGKIPWAEYGNYEDIEGYRVIFSGEQIGYHSRGKGRLSNFHIIFSKWILSSNNNHPISYYNGEILLNDGSVREFKEIPVSILENISSFRNFIANLCGPRAMMEKPTEIVKAVKIFNANVKCYEQQEFGFNDQLNCFYTEELVITSDEILEEETSIKYSEFLENNLLGFRHTTLEISQKVKEFIIEKLLKWDNPKVIFNLLAFTVYPIVYSFLKQTNPNKFYLMLVGKSGSGKTQISKWMQRFYGTFNSLTSWTSTPTSLSITGTAYKDALFLIDDLKPQNFKTADAAREMMMLIQNYSDGTSKKRGNVDLKLKEERLIKGHLLITAEDVLITESSSIARGIIIEVNSKPVKNDELLEIDEMSKKFNEIMPYLIQSILKHHNMNSVGVIFRNAQQRILSLVKEENLSPDNLPRALNNFAALRVSWEIICNFLLEDKSEDVKKTINEIFDENLIDLLKENLERIKSQKPEEIFESKFWDLVENGTFSFRQVLPDGNIQQPKNGKVVGHYAIGKNEEIRLIVQLSTILKELKSREDNFSISENVLKSILIKENKIKTTPGGRFSLYSQKPRGVEWIGVFPEGMFGQSSPVG